MVTTVTTVMTTLTVRPRLLAAAALLLAAGCRSYWPLSKDLEERIQEETSGLPGIGDDDAVVATGEQAAGGDLEPPEAFELPAGADLGVYIRLALERNPRIRARIRDVEALGMRVPQVTSLADPMLTFVPPTGDLVETAAGRIRSSLGLSQSVPFPTKLAAMGRVAEQVVRIALENLRSERLAVIAEVKEAYYDFYLTEFSITVTRDHQILLERLRDSAAAKYRAGTVTQQDVLRAEWELYNLSNDLITLEQDRQTAIARLNMLMDRDVRAGIPAPKLFDPARIEWRLDALMARAVELSPELEAIRARVKRDVEAVRLARQAYLPDFTIGAAYSFISGGFSPVSTGDDVWNIGLGMTLPIWLHRIRAGILERNAEVLASTLRYRDARNRIFYLAQALLVRVDASFRSAVLFRDAILPRARQAVDVSESGYQAGRVNFLTLIDNWRKYLDLTLQYYRSLADLERGFAELEALVGGDLPRKPPAGEEAAGGSGETEGDE